MLKALLHGKARLSHNPDEGWTSLEDYRDREDALTSFVFGTLLYLPADELWRILRAATNTQGTSALPLTGGDLALAQFWPTWWLSSADGPRRRVEPDLFLSFEACDVIVEAKRYDGQQMQYPAQLARELAAYVQAHGSTKPLYMLAVGGLFSTDARATDVLRQETADELNAILGTPQPLARIVAVPWANILRAVRTTLDTVALSRAYKAILLDVAAAFDLHHIVDWQPTWLADLASSILEHHLAVTNWEQLAWRSIRPSHDTREESSEDWWRKAAAYRPTEDRALRVFELLTGGDKR